MIFEYAAHKTFLGAIDVVDIGNTCLKCTCDSTGAEWFIVTKTRMGKVSILAFGPTLQDPTIMPDGFSATFSVIDYKEGLIKKNISSFINDPKKDIGSVENISRCRNYF